MDKLEEVEKIKYIFRHRFRCDSLRLMVATVAVVLVKVVVATTTMTLVDASYFLVKGNPLLLDTNSTLFSYKDMYK